MANAGGWLCFVLAFLLMSPFTVRADPFTFVWSDTLDSGGILPAGVSEGDPVTFSITVDNGGSTAASQTWTSANFVSAAINVNNGTYTGQDFTITAATGSFETDGLSDITSVPSSWVSSPGSGTDSLGTTNLNWFINGQNAFWTGIGQPPYVFFASLVSDNSLPLSWTLLPGSIDGDGMASTPEPSAFVLAVFGLVGLTLGRRPRRRRG
jgi:hypothetical protein